MSPSRPTVRPSFFWQGMLTVLPVFVLASLGLVSLRQDQQLAEQEASQRARDIVQQLAITLTPRLAWQFSQFSAFADQFWQSVGALGLFPKPGNTNESSWEKAKADFNRQRAQWSANYPRWHAEDVLSRPVIISASGQSTVPRDMPDLTPSPPQWFSELTSASWQAWQSARALEAANPDDEATASAWRQFLETTPPVEARANAEFSLLEWQVRTNSAAIAMQELLDFGAAQHTMTSESGLPLAAVVFARALRLAPTAGMSEQLFNGLRQQVFDSPSILTPYFLIEAERLGENGPSAILEAIFALRRQWEHQEHLRTLLRQLRLQSSIPSTNLQDTWIETPSGRWLATSAPITAALATPSDGPSTNASQGQIELRFFLKPIVEQLFEDAMRTAGPVIPNYFGITAEFEGDIVFGQAIRRTNSPALLATAFAMFTRLPRPIVDTPKHEDEIVSVGSSAAAMASEPAVALKLYLTDPAALYARQRQRTLWFGCLILAVTLAALVGFIRARRAFLREHQLGELKTNFVSSVSHELRAPIASVRLMAESLERGKVPDPVKQREYFRFIVQECRRLSSLISNVLDFSRIEQGRKQYEFEPTDVVALLRDTVKLMAPAAADRNVTLALVTPDGPPATENSQLETGHAPPSHCHLQPVLDGRAIQQSLVNLIDNAIKHSPSGSVINVGCGTKNGTGTPATSLTHNQAPANPPSLLQIWVEDHGPGIPAAEHERIFERFYRLGSELRRESQGVGIGLSIVKHIVEAHGGRVVLESELGQGSRFILEIPSRVSTSTIMFTAGH